MLTKEELPECPVATTVQLVGSKWKLLILRNLLARPWRFNELRKDLEGISQKVLDVYKRQVFPRRPEGAQKRGRRGCGSPCGSFAFLS